MKQWVLGIYMTSRPGSLKERMAYLVLFILGAQWKRWKYKNGKRKGRTMTWEEYLQHGHTDAF